MKKAMLIANPDSGKERSTEYQQKALEAVKRNGYETSIRLTEKQSDATKYAREACSKEMDLLIVMGGDGTVNEAINGLAEQKHRPILSIIPLGTVNNLARALSIPLQTDAAIELLEKDTFTKEIDIAKTHERYFMSSISIGPIAEAFYGVPSEQKSKLGALAYVLEGAKKLRDDEGFNVEIDANGKVIKKHAFLILVALTNSVGGYIHFNPKAEVDDGKMHIFIFEELSAFNIFSMVGSTLSGNLQNDDHITYLTANRITIRTDQILTANVDGEEGPHTPVKLKLLPSHLEVIVPKP
ncbi:diacylglycerol/lipid kinase family protein [Oceanobacillus piezotolerans]|nr:diacylglycerol kinase family protein [Oceanobacillus piezotolerans]